MSQVSGVSAGGAAASGGVSKALSEGFALAKKAVDKIPAPLKGLFPLAGALSALMGLVAVAKPEEKQETKQA